MKLFFALFIALSTSVAFGQSPAPVQFELNSGYVKGVGIINIEPANNGNLSVLWDRNECGDAGCTELFFEPKVVTPMVIENRIAADGPALIQLTNNIKLKVNNRMTGGQSFTALIQINGTEVSVPLTSFVQINSSFQNE